MSATAETAELRQTLRKTFGDRVRYDEHERRAYARDASDLPDLIESRIENIPDAVVQPASEAEVEHALAIASQFDLPVVPRGSGTSGYGGALPIAGGLVLHFARMADVREVDPSAKTVTVGPGAVWDDVQAALHDADLELPMYPTSAAGSTVAGWVAEDGAGIGSAANGYIRDHIERIRLVTPDGEVHKLAGDELDAVIGSEGTTGIITEVTVSVASRREKTPYLLAFEDLADATRALQKLSPKGAVWHAGLFNPTFATAVGELRAESPPEKYIVMVAAEKSIEELVDAVAAESGGQVLEDELAAEEWAERLRPLQFKQNAPSLVPAESVVPMDSLEEAITAYEATNDEFRIEGHAIGGEEVAILGFVPADAREATYGVKWADSLEAMDGAEAAGGRAYAVGSYFINKNADILGDRIESIESFKDDHDPAELLNPGTVFEPERADAADAARSLSRLMRLGSVGSSFSGFGKWFFDLIERDTVENDLGMPDVLENAYACASCAACVSACTISDSLPWESSSPKGKWSLLQDVAEGELPYDDRMSNLLHLCTTCKRCTDTPTTIGDPENRCMVDIEIPDNFFESYAAENETFDGIENPALSAISQNVREKRNFFGNDPEKRMDWVPEDASPADEAEYVLWSSCWDSFMMPNRSANLSRLLEAADVTYALPDDENCCGLYNFLAGRQEDVAKYVQENIDLFEGLGASTLIVSCPGCTATFSEVYPEVTELLGIDWDIEINHVLEVLDELIQSGELTFDNEIDATVTYHDSCHVGRWHDVFDEPRRILDAIPGIDLVEMEHNREDALCCGLVSGFSSVDVAQDVGTRRAQEAMDTDAEYLVTNCAGCGPQLNATLTMEGSDMRVRDITDLVAEAAGVELVETPNEQMLENIPPLIDQLEGRNGRWLV